MRVGMRTSQKWSLQAQMCRCKCQNDDSRGIPESHKGKCCSCSQSCYHSNRHPSCLHLHLRSRSPSCTPSCPRTRSRPCSLATSAFSLDKPEMYMQVNIDSTTFDHIIATRMYDPARSIHDIMCTRYGVERGGTCPHQLPRRVKEVVFRQRLEPRRQRLRSSHE